MKLKIQIKPEKVLKQAFVLLRGLINTARFSSSLFLRRKGAEVQVQVKSSSASQPAASSTFLIPQIHLFFI